MGLILIIRDMEILVLVELVQMGQLSEGHKASQEHKGLQGW